MPKVYYQHQAPQNFRPAIGGEVVADVNSKTDILLQII